MSTSQPVQPPASDGLTPRQNRLIGALLTTPTITAAAEATNIPFATARRWLHDDPAFIRAYRDARRAAVEHSSAIIQAALPAAVAALLRALAEAAPPALQVRAAQIVLEHAARAVELVDLAARIEQLEVALGEQQRAGGSGRGGLHSVS